MKNFKLVLFMLGIILLLPLGVDAKVLTLEEVKNNYEKAEYDYLNNEYGDAITKSDNTTEITISNNVLEFKTTNGTNTLKYDFKYNETENSLEYDKALLNDIASTDAEIVNLLIIAPLVHDIVLLQGYDYTKTEALFEKYESMTYEKDGFILSTHSSTSTGTSDGATSSITMDVADKFKVSLNDDFNTTLSKLSSTSKKTTTTSTSKGTITSTSTSENEQNPNTADKNILILTIVGLLAIFTMIIGSKKIKKV